MLQAIVPFMSGGQSVELGVQLSQPVDLTAKTLMARLEINYGLDSDLATEPGNASLYVRAGASLTLARGPMQTIDRTGTWLVVNFAVSQPEFVDSAAGPYDAGDIREIGISIGTASTAGGATTAVAFIDTIQD